MNSFRTSADTMAALARYDDLAGRRAAAGVPAEQGAQAAAPRTSRRSAVPQGPRPRVVPARPRRPLHRAARHRPARAAASTPGYERVFVSNSDNLGAVPDARVAGWFADVRCAVRDRGRPPYAVATARAATSPAASPTAGSCCARPRRPRPRTWRRWPTSTGTGSARPTTSGSTCARCSDALDAPRRHPRPAADPQRQDRRPGRPVHARGDPDRDRDGRGDRGLRGLPHDRGRPRPVRAGEDHQRPAGAALRRLRHRHGLRARPGRRRAARSSTSTATTTSWSREFDKRFPEGAPSLSEADVASRSTATGPSARGVQVVGDVELDRPSRGRAGRRAGTRRSDADDSDVRPVPCRSRSTSTGSSPRSTPLPAFDQPLMEALGLPAAEDVTPPIAAAGFDNSGDGRVRRGLRRRRRRHRRPSGPPAGGRRDRRRPGHAAARCRPAPPSRS